jgi:hypothetical protein
MGMASPSIGFPFEISTSTVVSGSGHGNRAFGDDSDSTGALDRRVRLDESSGDQGSQAG